ncbi:MAG: flagellin lysine-N-methylase [Selenomonadaceae bacterium]|nr:flagellin lysine-N-methylase [Selenomonadaceae bacterium]
MDSHALHQMKCLRPNYLRDFQCDGQQCSSRCCRNWRVVIDGDTHKKFLALDDHNIIDHIVDDQNGLTVKLKPNGDCPFLDRDLLCSIQKSYGEDHLAAICQAYPRVTYQLNDMLEQSLTLTCPVAARLILLSTEPITFETVEIDRPRFTFDWSNRVNDIDEPVELQLNCIRLLQDRALDIDKRLLNLCRLFNEPAVEPKPFDVDKHVDIMINIFEQTYSIEMSDAKRLGLKKIYIELRAEILEQLRRGSVLENYLVNEFFMRCYPFSLDHDHWLGCKIFVVGFKAMEFALVLNVISTGGRISVDELLNMIDAINERLDHHRGGMTAINQSARNLDGFDDFAVAMLDTN